MYHVAFTQKVEKLGSFVGFAILLFDGLTHAWATYGPRAKSGPPRLLIRPANKFSRAVGLCNISIFIYLYQYRYTFFMDIPVQTKLKTHCM